MDDPLGAYATAASLRKRELWQAAEQLDSLMETLELIQSKAACFAAEGRREAASAAQAECRALELRLEAEVAHARATYDVPAADTPIRHEQTVGLAAGSAPVCWQGWLTHSDVGSPGETLLARLQRGWRRSYVALTPARLEWCVANCARLPGQRATNRRELA